MNKLSQLQAFGVIWLDLVGNYNVKGALSRVTQACIFVKSYFVWVVVLHISQAFVVDVVCVFSHVRLHQQ